MAKLAGNKPSNGGAAKPAPFTAENVGGSEKGAGRPNLVQRRQEKIKQAVEAGKPFTFKERRDGIEGGFDCFCGAHGKNAIVLSDRNGKEVLVGNTCVTYTDATVPARERKARVGQAPGISRQQRFEAALAKYTKPIVFVRKQEHPFVCLCGGRGSNQIVCKDKNGVEFSVGHTCAGNIPGLDVPKPEPKRKKGAAVAGLKGTGTAAKPDFGEVG